MYLIYESTCIATLLYLSLTTPLALFTLQPDISFTSQFSSLCFYIFWFTSSWLRCAILLTLSAIILLS